MYGLTALLYAILAGSAAFIPDIRELILGMGALVTVPFALAIAQMRRSTVRGGAEVEVRHDGLYAEGRLAVPRSSIERADVVREGESFTVAIRRRNGFVAVVDVADAAEGQALVRALGRSADQALSEFQLDSPIASAMPWWALFALIVAPYLAMAVLSPLSLVFMPLACAMFVAALLPSRLTIGLDGVEVRWLWRRQLIRFSDLRGVDHDGEHLRLQLADGRKRRFSTRWVGVASPKKSASNETGFATRAAYFEAVAARVREAMTASGRAGEAPREALLRRGRDLSTWVSALRGMLARGPAGFREGETPPEKLWLTVEDGAADPEARAAAAIALQPALDGEDRQRLARVAEVVVAPRLRIALTAVAEDDDERLMEALGEMEAAEAERRGREQR